MFALNATAILVVASIIPSVPRATVFPIILTLIGVVIFALTVLMGVKIANVTEHNLPRLFLRPLLQESFLLLISAVAAVVVPVLAIICTIAIAVAYSVNVSHIPVANAGLLVVAAAEHVAVATAAILKIPQKMK